MFCDKCGSPVQPEQRFCSRCGREFLSGSIAFPQRTRVAEHFRFLGILWLALAALNAVGGLFLFVISNTIIRRLPEMSPRAAAAVWLHPFLSFIALLMFVKAGTEFLAGWGLLQREPWARMLTIVLAFLALFNIPFGTALGIYTLWVLLPAESDAAYQQQTRMAEAAYG
jgi:predicted nucleic acid-binding Zn ribbon protein